MGWWNTRLIPLRNVVSGSTCSKYSNMRCKGYCFSFPWHHLSFFWRWLKLSGLKAKLVTKRNNEGQQRKISLLMTSSYSIYIGCTVRQNDDALFLYTLVDIGLLYTEKLVTCCSLVLLTWSLVMNMKIAPDESVSQLFHGCSGSSIGCWVCVYR